MDTLIIFVAKYLIVLPPLLGLLALWQASPESRREIVARGAIILPLAYILALVVRHFWYDPRPFVVGGFAPLIPHAADNGFPSDHTLLAAALAATVGFSSRKVAAAMWVIALLVGFARVAAGVHHWADIAGSIVIVLASALAAHAIMPKLWNKNIRANS